MVSSARASRSSEPGRRPTSMRARVASVLACVAVGALAIGCDDILDDPTFRLWCGEGLCAWKLEAGGVRRAATWHEDDHGVELVDTPTVLSQSVDKSPKCLEFTMVADVEPSAQVSVALDFNRDGTVDFEQPIPSAKWRPVKTVVTAPLRYDGIKFFIKKSGPGRAVLAQLRVQGSSECGGAPVVVKDLPLGVPCSWGGAECASGVCCDGICSECCSPPGPVLDALPDGGSALPPERPCASGACGRRDAIPNGRVLFLPAIPRQCDPGQRQKPAGAECLADDDCASGACEGVVVRSESPQVSFASDAGPVPCVASLPDAGGDRCVVRAVAGGRCR